MAKLYQFQFRKNCEYSFEVQAETEQEAWRKVPANVTDWDTAWSEIEVERIEPEPE